MTTKVEIDLPVVVICVVSDTTDSVSLSGMTLYSTVPDVFVLATEALPLVVFLGIVFTWEEDIERGEAGKVNDPFSILVGTVFCYDPTKHKL